LHPQASRCQQDRVNPKHRRGDRESQADTPQWVHLTIAEPHGHWIGSDGKRDRGEGGDGRAFSVGVHEYPSIPIRIALRRGGDASDVYHRGYGGGLCAASLTGHLAGMCGGRTRDEVARTAPERCSARTYESAADQHTTAAYGELHWQQSGRCPRVEF
jgi:hypothetical protein